MDESSRSCIRFRAMIRWGGDEIVPGIDPGVTSDDRCTQSAMASAPQTVQRILVTTQQYTVGIATSISATMSISLYRSLRARHHGMQRNRANNLLTGLMS